MKKYALGIAVMAIFNDELVSLAVLCVFVFFGVYDVVKGVLK